MEVNYEIKLGELVEGLGEKPMTTEEFNEKYEITIPAIYHQGAYLLTVEEADACSIEERVDYTEEDESEGNIGFFVTEKRENGNIQVYGSRESFNANMFEEIKRVFNIID